MERVYTLIVCKIFPGSQVVKQPSMNNISRLEYFGICLRRKNMIIFRYWMISVTSMFVIPFPMHFAAKFHLRILDILIVRVEQHVNEDCQLIH